MPATVLILSLVATLDFMKMQNNLPEWNLLCLNFFWKIDSKAFEIDFMISVDISNMQLQILESSKIVWLKHVEKFKDEFY